MKCWACGECLRVEFTTVLIFIENDWSNESCEKQKSYSLWDKCLLLSFLKLNHSLADNFLICHSSAKSRPQSTLFHFVIQFVCVAQADYYRILTQGERSIQCIEEGGEVVMITEFRKTDGGSRQGQVVIKVSPLLNIRRLYESIHSLCLRESSFYFGAATQWRSHAFSFEPANNASARDSGGFWHGNEDLCFGSSENLPVGLLSCCSVSWSTRKKRLITGYLINYHNWKKY